MKSYLLFRIIKSVYSRRSRVSGWAILGGVLIATSFCTGTLAQAASPSEEVRPLFTFESVLGKARKLAQQPFTETKDVSEFLRGITYDEWRNIHFKPESALWEGEKIPFTVQFFHPGMLYNRTVKVNIVGTERISEVAFLKDFFHYGQNDLQEKIPDNLGFAGFRIHYPINTKDYYDEVAVFLGATYLRAVARNQQYGLSARGLAVDTALSRGEEFPYFKEFWIVKPAPGANEIVVYALLDSKSVTGAYRYVVKPGKETVMRVKSTLFMRDTVVKLGIAPLSSMFFYGETINQRPTDDFRPEVHDSDGLMIAFRSGEWLWRPFTNYRTLQIYSFEASNPVGFGLVQRDQDFNNYQDLEARYDLRPSVWISPTNSWGDGRVELIQIPTDNEMNDNIIALWAPKAPPKAGQSLSLSYTLTWHSADGARPPNGRVVATRTERGRVERSKKFIIDFAGKQLESFSPDKPLTAIVTVDERTRLLEQQLYKNRITKGWRLVFQILPEEENSLDRVLPPRRTPIELRAFLKDGNNAVTETWSHAFYPD
ncbi:MAG: glucan biosynthesis protein [Deltaproteobacteria bacterium]|nr:glucan biosynthesis protein [Deltaproteobacteria bacterium]